MRFILFIICLCWIASLCGCSDKEEPSVLQDYMWELRRDPPTFIDTVIFDKDTTLVVRGIKQWSAYSFGDKVYYVCPKYRDVYIRGEFVRRDSAVLAEMVDTLISTKKQYVFKNNQP